MRPDVSQKSQLLLLSRGYLPCHSKRKSLMQKNNTMLKCFWFFFESTGQLVWNTFQLCSKILPTFRNRLNIFLVYFSGHLKNTNVNFHNVANCSRIWNYKKYIIQNLVWMGLLMLEIFRRVDRFEVSLNFCIFGGLESFHLYLEN